MKVVFSILVLFVTTAKYGNCYEILGVFPMAARSHYFVGSSLMKGLAAAGHNVTVISPLTLSKPVPNYEEIVVEGVMELQSSYVTNFFDMANQSPKESIEQLFHLGVLLSNLTLSSNRVQNLIKSNRHFDLVIVEIFVSESLIGLGQHFNAPVIGLSTFGASAWVTNLIGTPSPYSFVPHPFLSFSDKMTFTERMGNTFMSMFETAYMNLFYYPKQEEIYNLAFPNAKKSFEQVMKEQVSLVLLNTHFSLGYPRPYLPNMIEVGGMHINRVPKALPQDLQTYLDSAPNGVVYFSMGSNIKSTQMPVEKRDGLLRAFAKLNVKVMWKWEEESLPGKPDNVLIKNWYPQDDILAHKNVRLFITHGGLLSTTEAIYHGVPIIGIPVFGDQQLNMQKAVRAKYGLYVDYKNLTEDSISWALNTMLSSNEFKRNAEMASARYRDQLKNPLETAVYWTEFIARHKGAPHMQSYAKQLGFVTYNNLDVFAFLALIVILFFKLIVIGFKKMFKSNEPRQKENNNKSKIKKRN